MSACCKVLSFCPKCACEKKQGLADAITQPTLDPIGTVREVPQLRDDCGCVRVVDLADEELGYMDKDGQ